MFEPTGAIERSVMGWGNRGWVEIIEYILETCIAGALKTHIMYRCNLNSKQITQYVEFLINWIQYFQILTRWENFQTT